MSSTMHRRMAKRAQRPNTVGRARGKCEDRFFARRNLSFATLLPASQKEEVSEINKEGTSKERTIHQASRGSPTPPARLGLGYPVGA